MMIAQEHASKRLLLLHLLMNFECVSAKPSTSQALVIAVCIDK